MSVTVIPHWGAWLIGLLVLLGLLLLDLAHHGLVARFDDWAFAKMPTSPTTAFGTWWPGSVNPGRSWFTS